MAGYTLTVNPQETRGNWEGWGTSLAWWGVAVGDMPFLADALFSLNDYIQTPESGVLIPGLGLNILRYNIGGCGRPGDGDVVNTAERNTAAAWYKTVEGYWTNWLDKNPASPSWDWSRDSRQRKAVKLALERGLVSHIEVFHNAPMWWMTTEKTAFGGSLQDWNISDFALYSANVTQWLIQTLQWPVRSIAICNEPSAGWWKPGHGQEGCNVSRKVQGKLLRELQEKVRSNPVLASCIRISGVDENQCNAALQTHKHHGLDVVQQVNVHGYDGGVGPNRDCQARRHLREAVHRHIPLWVSEYGDGDLDGLWLAHSITEDFAHLQPTAWVYWQAVETCGADGSANAWGLINTNFGGQVDDPYRGTKTQVNNKYFVMAQFTRFIRPGMVILGSSDGNSVCAYDPRGCSLVVVTLNWASTQTIVVDLSRFKALGGTGTSTCTRVYLGGGAPARRLESSKFNVVGSIYAYLAEPHTLYSLVFDRVIL